MTTANRDDPYADRRQRTFEQAEGVEPLPTQLQPKELSKQLRAIVWLLVYESLKADTRRDLMGDVPPYFGDNWGNILYAHHVMHEHLMADDFENNASGLTEKLKILFLKGDYVTVFGFLQFVTA